MAVSYGKELMYFALLVREAKCSVTLKFLENRGNGVYAFKKQPVTEEVPLNQIFMRDLKLNMTKKGYEVHDLARIRKKHEEFISRQKVRENFTISV